MKISIVTVVLDRRDTIGRTLASVAAQTHANKEHIVIDGGSVDGTLGILESASVRFVSERDDGIYDAMNKGIRLATGEIVAILNSDDYYHDETTLAKVAAAFEADPELKVVYGDNLWVDSKNTKKVIRYANGDNWNAFTARCGVMPPHATFFVRKECFEKYGYYDTSYRICADFKKEAEFLVVRKLKSRYLNFPFMTMVKGGVSSSGWRGYWTSICECRRACRELGLWTCWPMQFVKFFVKLPQLFRNVV